MMGLLHDEVHRTSMLDPLSNALFPSDDSPAGIYIHVPFCKSRCRYCGFVSTIHDLALEEAYVSAVIREIALWRSGASGSMLDNVTVDSIYFGGGDPSVLLLRSISEILEECFSSFPVTSTPEITLEINPASRSDMDLRALLRAGVDRVSLGIQSLENAVLRLMGRRHTAEDALKMFRELRSSGFENISVDIMAGFPGQSRESVSRTTKELLSLGPDHLSLYLLEVKAGTALEAALIKGDIETPDDDLQADMYEDVRELAELAGYEQYEIANYARGGRFSRHNMKYWSDKVYLGLGPGAHGMTGRHRYAHVPDVREYCAATAQGDLPFESIQVLTPAGRLKDALIMGLRLVRGVNLRELSLRYSVDARRFVMETIGDLEPAGLYHYDGDTIALSERGRLLSNIVFSRWV
jgi:oxygen-independent coproporphyrinogen-3 oxidase